METDKMKKVSENEWQKKPRKASESLKKESNADLENILRLYKEQNVTEPREEKLLETVRKSREAFMLSEMHRSISYSEFLFAQFRLIRKRWWALQTLMLGLVSFILPKISDKISLFRILSVLGVLFVVLIIPEFWRNKHYACMEVEGTCLYSLRQIYTARMLWFGVVDMFLLTFFCLSLRGNIGLGAEELFIQFLFPMLVAACICFGTLCSNTQINDVTAILFCLLWNSLWCFLVLNEAVYRIISFPIWCLLFCFFAVLFLGTLYKTIHDCNEVRVESPGHYF